MKQQIRQHIQLLTQQTLLTTEVYPSDETKEANDEFKKMTSEIMAKTLEIGQPGDAAFTVSGLLDGKVYATNSEEEVKSLQASHH